MKGRIVMSKAKKTISEKTAKLKAVKSLKVEKPEKEKKAKKKDKEIPALKAEPSPKPAKAAKKPLAPVVAKPVKTAAPEPVLTLEDISLRAYFIAERRQAMGWPGDSEQDWIEAERQLKAEAKRKAAKK